MNRPPLTDAVTPLPGASADAVAWRFKGQLHVTVIVKATFAFAHDTELPRVEPQEILRADVHNGNSPMRSVRFTSDVAPYKGSVDVLFSGHAHAPQGTFVRSLPVRVALFDGARAILDKALLVQDTAGFHRMPIVYERAFGGPEVPDNPFGVEPTQGDPQIINPTNPGHPAGYGPIARSWPARRRLLGNLPRRALEEDIPEIPEDFDWSYFLAAPLDQRLNALRGDEWIVLEGLHPTLPRLRMRLPRARGGARIYGLAAFGTPEGQPLDLLTDTIQLDGDDQICCLVARQSFTVLNEAALSALRIVAGVELPTAPFEWPDPSQLTAPKAAAKRQGSTRAPNNGLSGETVLVDELAPNAPALPFDPSAVPAIPPAQPRAEGPIERSPHFGNTLDLPLERGDQMERRPAVPPEPALVPLPVAPYQPSISTVSPWAMGARARSGETESHLAPTPIVPHIGPAAILPSLDVLAAHDGLHVDSGAVMRAPDPPLPEAVKRDAQATEPASEAPAGGPSALDLLWFDPKSLPRIRKLPALRAILDRLEDKPLDPDIDDPALDLKPGEAESRREIFEVLAHGEPLSASALRDSIRRATRDDGRFVAPLVMLAGELAVAFDGLDTLRASVAVMAAIASGDEDVQRALEAAREFLRTPDLLSSAAMAESLRARLEESYVKGKRDLPFAHLETQVERALLEHRRYERRTLLGGRHLRGLLQLSDEPYRIATYLPEALVDVLPMSARFPVRLIAEAHLPLDPCDVQPVALRLRALARVDPSARSEQRSPSTRSTVNIESHDAIGVVEKPRK